MPPPARSPARLRIMLTSSISAGSSGGRIDGRRCASMDFPAPGGPITSRLWPPAAATSSARLALSWPLMSFKSGIVGSPASGAGCGRRIDCSPLKWLTSMRRSPGARIVMSADAQAASAPQACGQMRPLPSAFAPIAAGSTPATGAMEPSSASSPSTQKPSMASRAMAPAAAITDRDWKIVVTAFLWQVRRREVHGDALRR
jgi:hypothetical protein